MFVGSGLKEIVMSLSVVSARESRRKILCFSCDIHSGGWVSSHFETDLVKVEHSVEYIGSPQVDHRENAEVIFENNYIPKIHSR